MGTIYRRLVAPENLPEGKAHCDHEKHGDTEQCPGCGACFGKG